MALVEEKGPPSLPEVHALKLEPGVEEVLSEVFPSDDPLDSPEFEPVAFINKLFPTEASLGPQDGGELSQFLRTSRGRIVRLENEISKSVRDASVERSKTENSILDAKEAIQDLFSKVKSIKEKANQSEVMVKEICRDIKKLDYAKKNLTATITALKRLHMLGSAVDQLQHVTASSDSARRSSLKMNPSSQYEQAALNLQAVDILFSHFEDYKHIPKVSELREQVTTTRRLLEDNVFEAFSNFHRSGADMMEADQITDALRHACRVAEVLGEHVKKRLTKWMCSVQLEPYRQIFSPGTDEATLENTERRFAWLKRQLKQYHERYGEIFPRDWNVPGLIAADFCKMTHDHLSRTLEITKESLDVQALLRVLQLTIQFEDELQKYYSMPTVSDASRYLPEITKLDEDMTPGERIKRKYAQKRMEKEKKEKEADEARERRSLSALPEEERAKREAEVKRKREAEKIDFRGLISSCYAPYFGKIIGLERANIREVNLKIENDEKWMPDPTAASVENRFAGSDEILMYVKKSLQRSSQLGVKQTLFDVYREYKRGFMDYCSLLDRKLLPTQQAFARRSDNGFSEAQLLSCCFIVNTAEYMSETLPQLESSIKKMIDSEFEEKVDFAAEIEKFQELINKGLQVVVSAIVSALSGPLNAMSRMPWATLDSTGDRSDYVTELHQILVRDVSIVAKLISKDYHTFFCSELARAFVPAFIQSVYRCRKLNEFAIQQLLLDVHTIKTFLQEIPSMGVVNQSRRIPGSYQKFVTKEVLSVQNLLKVVTSEDPVDTFRLLFPQGHPNDLRSVLDLKGFGKSDKEKGVQDYLRRVDDPNSLKKPLADAPQAQDTNIMRKLFKFTT